MTSTSKPDDAALRAMFAQQNSDALMRLCAEHGITLRTAQAHLWRPTLRVRGDIPGVAEGLTAWFINDETTLLHGHIQKFTGAVKTLYGMPKPKATPSGPRKRARSASQTPTAKAVALLQQMLDQLKTQ